MLNIIILSLLSIFSPNQQAENILMAKAGSEDVLFRDPRKICKQFPGRPGCPKKQLN